FTLASKVADGYAAGSFTPVPATLHPPRFRANGAFRVVYEEGRAFLAKRLFGSGIACPCPNMAAQGKWPAVCENGADHAKEPRSSSEWQCSCKISQATAGVVRAAQARFAVAPHEESLPRLALRNHVAANARRRRSSVLPALPPTLSRCADARSGAGAGSAAIVGRAWLLQPRAQSSESGAPDCGGTRRAIPQDARRGAGAGGHWELYGRSDSQHRLRRKTRRARWQRRARSCPPRRDPRRPAEGRPLEQL